MLNNIFFYKSVFFIVWCIDWVCVLLYVKFSDWLVFGRCVVYYIVFWENYFIVNLGFDVLLVFLMLIFILVLSKLFSYYLKC